MSEQIELGSQELGGRCFIDYRYAPQVPAGELEPKLAAKHRDQFFLQRVQADLSDHEVLYCATASLLGRCDLKNQQRATRIGVDLDEFRSVTREVKVVSEKHAARTVMNAGEVRYPIQHQAPVCLQLHDLIDRFDHVRHLVDMVARNKDR